MSPDSVKREQRRGFKDVLLAFVRSICLEPMIFIFIFGGYVVSGADWETQLKLWNVCHVEFGYNETVCENLDDPAYEDIEVEVQQRVNNFQIIVNWVNFVPSIVYVLFIGALCDNVGLRWLVIFPIAGYMIGAVFALFNAIYVEQIALEMFILNEFGGFTGGFSVYYLGVYGIGSAMARPEKRAQKLTLLDGIERLAITLGIFASPRIAESIGYVYVFVIKLVAITLSLIYALIFVKNPLPPQENLAEKGESLGLFRRVWNGIYKHIFINVAETMRTIFKPRKFHMRAMIILHLALYALIIMEMSEQQVTFLYMRKVFDASGEEYANMGFIGNLLAMIGLLIVMPIVSGKYKVHEALLASIFSGVAGIGMLTSGLAEEQWVFYLGNWLLFLSPCLFGMGRAMITKCVLKSEYGKVLSGNALISSVFLIIGGTTFRLIYDATIETQPNTVMLVCAALMFMYTLGNVGVYVKRDLFVKKAAHDHEFDELDQSETSK